MDFLTLPVRSDKFSMNWAVKESLCSVKSPFQHIDIVDTVCFGKALLLDGHIQFTLLDEFAYHESLVHIPSLSIPDPKRALVVGGGDGGVVRELCKHLSLEQIHMVEIDQAVIDTCRQHLPELQGASLLDSRVEVIVGDAFPFVKQAAPENYDLIILDSTDVYEEEEGELSEMLFTPEFYRDCFNALSPKGMVVTQADNLVFCPYSLEEIRERFSTVFPVVGDFWGLVPSFGGFSGFCYASKGQKVLEEMPDSPVPFRYLNQLTWRLSQTDLPFVTS